MLVWLSLIGGVLLGWLIEWIVDWLYWRRGLDEIYANERRLQDELAQCRREAEELRNQLDAQTSNAASTSQNNG